MERVSTNIDLTTAGRDVLITIIAQLQATVLEQQRRGIMAKKLAYATTDEASAASSGLPEMALIGAYSKC